MKNKARLTLTLLLTLVASLTLNQLASAALFVTRAELRGDQLRLEGEDAVPDATILVDGQPLGTADGNGEFRVERSGFSSATCEVVVSDGLTSVQVSLDDCTPSATNTPAPTATTGPTGTPMPTNTPAPTTVPTNTPAPTSTPLPTATLGPTNTPAPTNTPLPTATATTLPSNQPPVADAGADQTVRDEDGDGVETITLDAGGSSDADGMIVSYEWREVDGQQAMPFGNTIRAKQLLSVAAGADFILESNQPDPPGVKPAAFGGQVDSAGDVNGDGFEDIIVGAPGWNGGDTHEGAAFIFLGSAAGISGNNPANAHARLESNQAFAQFGTVAGAGDVNGDGYDDVIVGAHFYDSTLPGTNLSVDGALFVFHGGPQGITGTDPTTADGAIFGNEILSDLGGFLDGAGDVNGDGYDDIIVGVPNHGTPFPPEIPPNDRSGDYGAALIFYGGPAGITGTGFDDAGAVLLSYEDTGQPEPPIYGRIRSVASAGDVNGDGYDDVVLGGTEVALYLGGPGGIPTGNLTTADARIQPDSGIYVAGAGDVNGDGFDDIVAGSPARDLEPGSTKEEGAAYVFLGSAAGITATTTTQAHATFTGNLLAEWVGHGVAGAGDVDGDGFDDVLVGARVFPGSLDNEGVAYLFRGSALGITAQSLLDADARLEERQSGAAILGNDSALDLDGAGDVNGDGLADVIVGKGYYDHGEENEGAAFVYLGQTWPANPNRPPVAAAGADQFVVDVDNSGTAAVLLDGRASFDPDGSITAYAWYLGETLLGETATLQTELRALGDLTVVLVVTDDEGVSRGDPLTVRVEPPETDMVTFDNFDSLDGWATGGDVTLSTTDEFSFPAAARIGPTGAFMRRAIALPAGATGVQLRFWGKARQFAAGDELHVNVSVDGAPFTNLLTLTAAASNGAYQFYGGSGAVVSLSWYPTSASSVVLQFESAMTSGEFFVDDLRVDALIASQGGIQAPVASAGADQTVADDDGDGQERIVVDGSASVDPDGTIVAYEWREGATILGNTATVALDLPLGDHTLTLTVTDNDGLTHSDTVLVTVAPPGPPSSPVLTLPVGVHVFELTVTDDDGATATDTVVITVEPQTSAPQAQLAITAPASAQRGDFVDITLTVQNSGAATLQGVELTLSWSPSNRLRDLSAANTIQLGDIAPGAGASFTWRARADRRGAVEISGTAILDGALLASGTHTMEILR